MRSLFNFFTDKSPVVHEERTRAEIELEQTRKELRETKDELAKTKKKLRKSKRSVAVLQVDNMNLRDTINILTAESNLSAEIDSIKNKALKDQAAKISEQSDVISIKDKALKDQAAEISEQSDVISKLRNEKAELLIVNALTDLKCAMLHAMVATLKTMDSVTKATSNGNSA
jgi:uncharacterized protein (DUF3084 family)